MDNIPSSFMGYNKEKVNEIINQKDNLLSTQKEDINYLRNEISRLEKQIKKDNNKRKIDEKN